MTHPTQRNTRPPSDRQRDVLAFMLDFMVEYASPPSIREIAAALDISSVNGVRSHLERLAAKGYVCQPSGEGHHWWPCRLLDGTRVRWQISPVSVDAEPVVEADASQAGAALDQVVPVNVK